MSQKTFIGIFVSTVLLAILANASTFLVRGIEQVVVVRMGRIVRVINEDTGIYVKWPILDQIIRLDKRVMSLNFEAIQVPTSSDEFIAVSTIAQWRIADPSMFIRAAQTEEAGAALLGQILIASVRSQAAQLTVDKVVGRALIMANCSERVDCESTGSLAGTEAAMRASQYGIDLRDFRILNISQTPNVRAQVESRMIAERLNAAELVYAEGVTTSARIAADADLQVQKIISQAQQHRDDFLAVADRQILERMTVAYNDSQEFYGFFQTMNAYEQSLGKNATLMLPTNSEFFQYLKSGK